VKLEVIAPLTELPVRREHAPDECGVGFLMRLATANGMTLFRLLGWLQTAQPTSLRAADIRRINRVSGVSVHWLSEPLPQRILVDGQTGWHFLGEVWSRSVAFRCRETQVCPQCLYERGYCRGFWRLSTISACTVHARWLLDRCRACGRPIGWTRPAVDICQCKRALKSSGDDAAPELLLRWCDWVERRIVGAQVEAKSCGLPPWFDHLTVDGASSLVRLVGLRERAHERISAATAARPTDTAATAIQRARGLRRLLDLDPDGSESVRALSPYIHEGGLQLLARVGVGAADRRLADRWLTWVAGRTCTTPRAAGVPATGSSACSTDGFASFRAPR
jgi:hypothetical protein